MAGTAINYSPEDGLITSSTEALELAYQLTPGATGIDVGIWLNGTRIARYVSETLTPIAGYHGTVSIVDDVLSIRITKDVAWTHNAPMAWYSTYDDDDSSLTTEATRHFVYATMLPNTITPTELDDLIPARPTIYQSFDFSFGSGQRVEFVIAGEVAEYPAYTVATGGLTTRAYGQATPRRGFPEGVPVLVQATPYVRSLGIDYHGNYETVFTPKSSYTPTVEPASFRGPFRPLLGETLRRLVSTHLVPHATSPGIRAVVAWLSHHSNVGGLVRGTFALTELRAVDLPGEDAMRGLVQTATPVWNTALRALAPLDSQEMLAEAWNSRNTIEQAAALCVLVAYASGEVR